MIADVKLAVVVVIVAVVVAVVIAAVAAVVIAGPAVADITGVVAVAFAAVAIAIANVVIAVVAVAAVTAAKLQPLKKVKRKEWIKDFFKGQKIFLEMRQVLDEREIFHISTKQCLADDFFLVRWLSSMRCP